MNYAPIIITVYTRLQKLKLCIEALKKNPEAIYSDLYIISDAPSKLEDKEKVQKVRTYLDTVQGFNSLTIEKPEINSRISNQNYSYILQCELIKKYKQFIFLEDDVVVSKHFLRFMNESLIYYKHDKNIGAICAYQLPFKVPKFYKKDIYLGKRYSPWGFAITKEWFEKIDFTHFDRYSIATTKKNKKKFLSVGKDILDILKLDSTKKIEAPDVRICYHQIMNNLFCIFPIISLTKNIGFDEEGEHCKFTDRFDVTINDNLAYNITLEKVKPNKTMLKRFQRYEDSYIFFITPYNNIKQIIILVIKKILKTLGIFAKIKYIYKKNIYKNQ